MSKYSEKLKRRKSETTPIGVPLGVPYATPSCQQKQHTSGTSGHFCAGVICQKMDGFWCFAGITDERFPNDIRIPGGTNKNAPWEEVIKTLHRELGEELGVVIEDDSCAEVHSVNKRGHTQHFFIVRKWNGLLRVGPFKDSDGASLVIKWVTLAEFWRRCFKNHQHGFWAAVQSIAAEIQDQSFVLQARGAGIIF